MHIREKNEISKKKLEVESKDKKRETRKRREKMGIKLLENLGDIIQKERGKFRRYNAEGEWRYKDNL